MDKNSKIKNLFQGFKLMSFVYLAMVFMSCTNTKENDLSDWGLKGNVKTCFTRYYEVENKFGKWEKGKRQNSDLGYFHNQVTLDKKGLKQEIEFYNADMELIGKRIFVREKEQVLEDVDYDGDGKLLEKRIFVRGNGQILEDIVYDGEGKLRCKHKYNYMPNSEIVKSFYFYGEKNDSICTDSVNIIREKDKIVKRVFTRISNDTISYVRTTFYEYNEDGNITSEKIINETVYKGEVVHNGYNVNLRYEYLEFDVKKNWIKKITIKEEDGESKPTCMEIREIEYY